MQRCAWATSHKIEQDYHDTEWGVPVHDDRLLFEMLCLEGAQTGLSWLTILSKRKGYQKAFSNFEVDKVARFTDRKCAKLLENEGIVRHKLKINSVVHNAKMVLKVQKEWGSFSNYIWSFTHNSVVQNNHKKTGDVPSQTPVSELMSKDMKKRGFKFVGPTVCYAFMQGIGMVNDHTIDCHRHAQLK